MTADEATSPTLPGFIVLPRSAPLSPGTILDGRFRLDEVLGGGGVGIVYRARQLALGRDVAVKVLRKDMSVHPELAKRFDREARTLSRLSHPNIVRVDDFGLHGRVPYLVMELLAGRTLDDEMRAGPLGVRRSIAVTRQVVAALAHAHQRGVIHRDVKATNVMIFDGPGEPDRAKVFDFGLARLATPEREGEEITRHGTINGTPEYMSPEQVWGGIADERSDLYSVGVLLFEMLTGRLPFSGDPVTLLAHHVRTAAPRLREAAPSLEVPEALEDLVARALEKDRDLRPASAAELLEALDAVARELDSPPVPAAHIVAKAPPATPRPSRRDRGAGWRLTAAFLAGPILAVIAAVLIDPAARELRREPSDRPAPGRVSAFSLHATEAPPPVEPGASSPAAESSRVKVGKTPPEEPRGPASARSPAAFRSARPRWRRPNRLPRNPY